MNGRDPANPAAPAGVSRPVALRAPSRETPAEQHPPLLLCPQLKQRLSKRGDIYPDKHLADPSAKSYLIDRSCQKVDLSGGPCNETIWWD